MTTDHRKRNSAIPTELWSLREDVHVEFEPADGPVLLHSHWGDVTIQRPVPVVREALRRMLLGPISLENVVAGRRDTALRQTASENLAMLHKIGRASCRERV